ncbi:DivIVA domain-containing protein [Micromonospora sp. CA-111912]|uniref:DivIVA domain-containing protein n=1 Tax=Micromonospora sp. CA-111912 TaxID=3239955 RepID=UPI003D8C3B4F
MRNLLNLVRSATRRGDVSRRGRQTRSPNAGWYRPEATRPLTAGQVRDRRFATVWRGLDPAEVHAFLDLVAGELAATRRELAHTTEENARIKRALRSWHSRFAPPAGSGPRREGGRW